MTQDFKNLIEFPGEILDGRIYAFPRLTYKDIRGRGRFWRQFMRIIDGKQRKMPQNWDISDNKGYKVLEILDEHFASDFKFSRNAKVQMWTESGIDGKNTSRSSPTYVLKGKNIGKKNATSIFTQALTNARANYRKKRDKITPPQGMYYPQSLHKYEVEAKDDSKNITYPAAFQVKFDGVRAVSFYDNNKVVMYSRGLKEFPINKMIRKQLEIVFQSIANKYPNLYLDGELFVHKMRLQDIVGLAKKPSRESILKYYIFDCFDPTKPELTFQQRYNILQNIFHNYDIMPRVIIPKEYLVFVECKILNKTKGDLYYAEIINKLYTYSKSELQQRWNKQNSKTHRVYIYEKTAREMNKEQLKKYVTDTAKSRALSHFYGDPVDFVDLKVNSGDYQFVMDNINLNKFEGVVIRNLNAPYEIGKNREIRSYWVRKRKPHSTAEFPIWDFKEGKGKNKGVLTWVLKTAKGKTFSADVNMDLETRANMFKEFSHNRAKFNKEYRGRLLTVKFFTISKDGIPTQPKVIGFRDIK